MYAHCNIRYKNTQGTPPYNTYSKHDVRSAIQQSNERYTMLGNLYNELSNISKLFKFSLIQFAIMLFISIYKEKRDMKNTLWVSSFLAPIHLNSSTLFTISCKVLSSNPVNVLLRD